MSCTIADLQLTTARKSGYTLVEVLIGLLIFSFLFVGGYTGYKDFISRREIDSSMQDLRVNIAGAKQMAISGERAADCKEQGGLIGFRFIFFSKNRYVLSAVCSSGFSPYVGVYSTRNQVTFSFPQGAPNSVLFKSLGEGTDLTSDLQITFTHTIYGNQKTITITPAGVVQ